MKRKRFRWECKIQAERGQVVTRVLETYWSPAKDYVTEKSIAEAAAAIEYLAKGKREAFAGISAVLVT